MSSTSETAISPDRRASSFHPHPPERPSTPEAAVMSASVPPGAREVQVAPRRVNRACCSCRYACSACRFHFFALHPHRNHSQRQRRDKIRCDGARPCAGCLKKGLAPEKCIDGCFQCRRARARCDGANPCSTCAELKIDCTNESTPSSFRPDDYVKAAEQPGKLRTMDRAKLACFACRRDNKKCDDERPCRRCKARFEDCIHVTRGPKIVKSRCKRCREENLKCEDGRPCKCCEEAGEHCSDIPRKGRGHGQRVKAACIHCRKDKIQCDTERPCRGCVRRNLQCLDRTCACAEKGKGHECPVCRAQKDELRMKNYLGHSDQSERSSLPTPISYPQTSQVRTQFINEPSFPPQGPTTSQHRTASGNSLLDALAGLPVGSFPSGIPQGQNVSGPTSRHSLSTNANRNLPPDYNTIPIGPTDHYRGSSGALPFYGQTPMSLSTLNIQQPFTPDPRHLHQLYMPAIDPSIEKQNRG